MIFRFFERISPHKIISSHFATFYDARTEKLSIWTEILPLILLCLIASAALAFKLNVIIDAHISPYLLGGFSVAGGFLINSLMVLAEKHDSNSVTLNTNKKKIVLKETFYNTSFGVFLCLLATILCCLYPLSESDIWKKVVSTLIYFVSILFFHTLLMVIKRLNKVFDVT